mmetsp:Transcript_28670/g.28996  ORF Transcript_28670/g.28996 Transcript_28670/m.28996 type:complete len:975 (+) Transcript_28670:109-3033(+)|eukprot:CAMPEP_0182419064 /NCGR_PEP_ID=MMETSP1167-20130531/3459_1 /TAXON_ID=2988 /ORGANISM="Mallomonas Sp, Strain CCMP3275" /LENGTH=974 /DNA_ID=CAMNT_0024593663 /DNA_START=108 /DNA_END=3032 /DNA_ORIENTATION=-
MFARLIFLSLFSQYQAFIFRGSALSNRPILKLQSLTQAESLNQARSSKPKLENKPVSIFGKSMVQSKSNTKSLLGGKGANLADMSTIGLSVPPGFTVTTEVCAAFHSNGKMLPEGVWGQIVEGVASIESEMGRKFGDNEKPLLVSVRSGAAVSMPGMMDTILNLGLNDDTVRGLSKDFGERFAMDSYRRFLNMFGTVVLNIPHHEFEDILTKMKKDAGVDNDSQLSTEQLAHIVDMYKKVYTKNGKEVLTDPYKQLDAAIRAVFDSWQSDRAVRYREAEDITGLLGTAVNVQAMCFGNMGDDSGTGVCFTRNPNTGEAVLYGEYLVNAQGEDVVAGIRTPEPISTLKDVLPEAYEELLKNVEILEKYYHDMQDIEFTIQEGKLFMLQTRNGKRAGTAAVKIAVDMVKEGLASRDQALMSVKSEHLNQLLHPQFADMSDPSYRECVVTRGLPASPGAAVGRVVFSPELAEEMKAVNEPCLLVRDDTSPEDVGGMWAAEGILTSRGGMTSHAAVVARGWGKPCVCGCPDLSFDFAEGVLTITQPGGETVIVKERDWMSVNGDTGEVLVGKQTLIPPSIDSSDYLKTFMDWVDEKKDIQVFANADTPDDAAEARRNGAEGIGLTRTEHMFFSESRLRVIRRMILSADPVSKEKALQELLPFQRADFEGILEAMDGLPVTVRLLDPPLHEFLPKISDVDDSFAAEIGLSKEQIETRIQSLQEVNPMLGLRGCRLGITLPSLVEIQTRALVEAALHNKYSKGLNPIPQIMIPLISTAAEYSHQSQLIRSTIETVCREWTATAGEERSIDVKVGTMIEVPRAALTSYDIAAAGAEFFSYGTNDLTQMTFGYSRDDVGSFMPQYLKTGILTADPFQSIDELGVGQLIKISASAGRGVAMQHQREMKAGVCGEHGGDPKSVRFFVKAGMDYVSCSPFRVPVARLAAAQSVVETESGVEMQYTNPILLWFKDGTKLYDNNQIY